MKGVKPDAIAEIWYRGWRDGHLGHVPDALVAVRTRESFAERAAVRVGDAVVAVVGDTVAGFTMVVEDEVEQVYVSADHRGAGVAGVLIEDAERRVEAAGYRRAWLAVVAGNARARAFYTRAGWRDDGPFEYLAHGPESPVSVPAHRFVKPLHRYPD